MTQIKNKIEELKKERKVYIEEFVKLSKYVTSLTFENDKDLSNKLMNLSDYIYKVDEKIEFLENIT